MRSPGCSVRRIYDNMKTAVETVFLGKDRQFNRRFQRMCGHYLVVDPGTVLSSKTPPHRRRPVPIGKWVPAFAGKATGETRQ